MIRISFFNIVKLLADLYLEKSAMPACDCKAGHHECMWKENTKDMGTK